MEFDVFEATNGCTNGIVSDNGSLKPVPPCSSGEGPPYAPADWPNPGDVWKWKVGNKINPSGIYTHRFLLVPVRLQQKPTRKVWLGSKLSVMRFLQSEVPDADISAFFESFTWEIPGEVSSTKKVKNEPTQKATPMNEVDLGSQSLRQTRNSAKRSMKIAAEDTTTPANVQPTQKVTPENEAEWGCQTMRRTRNSTKRSIRFTSEDTTISAEVKPTKKATTPKKEVELGSRTSRRTRNSAKRSNKITAEDLTISTEVPILDEAMANEQPNMDNTASENDMALGLHDAVSPVQTAAGESTLGLEPQGSFSLADHLAQMTAEDFEIYLNSLDDIVSEPFSEPPNPALLQDEDFIKVREELSSLLAMGFADLIASNKLSELIDLTSKLFYDPDLSLEELSMLNLIQDIPQASQQYLDAKNLVEEACKFFVELEGKVTQITALKSEYMSSKDEIAHIQAEDASVSSAIREIDDEIATLRSRKAILANIVKSNKKKIAQLTKSQKHAFNSIPKIVDEVKLANSERSQWEQKQEEATRKESEILAKFASIDGFSFNH